MRRSFRSLFVAAFALAAMGGCGAHKYATKDPLKCERDPTCQQKRGDDCWTQCVDDPECVDRCRQIQGAQDGMGGR
jgi:hypothetical protein